MRRARIVLSKVVYGTRILAQILEVGTVGARVVRLARNSEKEVARDAGLRSARQHVIRSLDADVTGHTDETLSRITQPVIDGRYEMAAGIHSGERALTQPWQAVPAVHKDGFQIEITMNYSSKRFERWIGFELIGGTGHHTKERKRGFRLDYWR